MRIHVSKLTLIPFLILVWLADWLNILFKYFISGGTKKRTEQLWSSQLEQCYQFYIRKRRQLTEFINSILYKANEYDWLWNSINTQFVVNIFIVFNFKYTMCKMLCWLKAEGKRCYLNGLKIVVQSSAVFQNFSDLINVMAHKLCQTYLG